MTNKALTLAASSMHVLSITQTFLVDHLQMFLECMHFRTLMGIIVIKPLGAHICLPHLVTYDYVGNRNHKD